MSLLLPKMSLLLPTMPPRCPDSSLGRGSPDPTWAGAREMFPPGFGNPGARCVPPGLRGFQGEIPWEDGLGWGLWDTNPSGAPKGIFPFSILPLLEQGWDNPWNPWIPPCLQLGSPGLFQVQFSPKNPKQPNPNSSSQNSQCSLGAELGSFQIPGNSLPTAPTHSMEKPGKIRIQECKINPKYLKPPRQVEGRARLQQNSLLWIHEFPFPAVAQGAKEVEKGIYPVFWKLAEICSMPFSILVPRGLAYGKKKYGKKG